MKKEEKCIEYYFDSNKYNEAEILDKMKKEQIGFEKKNGEINIKLNEYGIYVVQLKFLENKISIFSGSIRKKVKSSSNYDKYTKEKRVYGQYKQTKTFQPI